MFDVDIFCPSSFCTDLLLDDSSHLRCVQEWDRKEGTAAAYLTQDTGDGCPFSGWSRNGGGGLGDVVFPNPMFIGSMHCIFTCIWLTLMVNIGKHTIPGSYG